MLNHHLTLKYSSRPAAVPQRPLPGELSVNAAGSVFLGSGQSIAALSSGLGGNEPANLVGVQAGVRAIASESIPVGAWLHLWRDGGTVSARLAVAGANPYPCHAFAINAAAAGALVVAVTAIGAVANNSPLIGTGDGEYFLAMAPGFAEQVASSRFVQSIGMRSGHLFIFNPQPSIRLVEPNLTYPVAIAHLGLPAGNLQLPIPTTHIFDSNSSNQIEGSLAEVVFPIEGDNTIIQGGQE